MFSCPLCCSDIFKSKELLLYHLSQITKNIICPICKVGISSIDGLISHLKGNCTKTIKCIDEEGRQSLNIQQSDYNYELANNVSQENYTNNDTEVIENNSADDSEVSSLYTEILDKEHVKLQELKIIKECNDRYVLIDNNDADINNGTTLVSKQNDDGTVTFSIEESNSTPNSEEINNHYNTKMEVENQDLTEDVEENQEEVYSCNTCGVTFTSVIDHIQNYHSDQDVVVEETLDPSVSDECEQLNEEVVEEKATAHRMITDTGDIVEEPIQKIAADEQVESANDQNKSVQLMARRRYIKMGKAADTVVNNTTKEGASEEPNGSYHKVVMKLIEAPNGNKVKVYNCIFCNFLVSSLTEFKQHPCIKTSKYTCSICKVTYDNAKSLCAHMKVHKEKPSPHVTSVAPKYECEICRTKFPTSKSFKLHKRMHAPTKLRPIQSPVETSDSAESFVCGVCQKVIPAHYRVVHQNSHKGSDELTCDMCNRKFPSRECLEMHINVHNMYKVTVEKTEDTTLPYQCVYCARQFARPHEKVKHERIHTGEKPHTCEICGKSFRVSYCLTLHMRTHTGARPYECPHCPKRFKAHSVYNHHILTHSEVRAYKCPYCPKAFKTSVQLAGHKNSHTKPFSCQQCNRPFASLYAVRVHMEVHTRQNSLKFKCTECGASYARAFALKDHVRQAHAHLDPAAGPTVNEITMNSTELIIS